MIIKGSARRSGAKALSDHLGNAADNERVRVVEIIGTMAETMLEAFRDFEAVAAGSRSRRPYYHASISPDRPLTEEQRERAIDLLEEKLGLTGQPRVVVEHVKEGREHYHVVWQRYEVEQGRMIGYSHNYRRHEEVARQLEQEFGHEPVKGVHVRDKETEKRPERAPSHSEQKQGERLGIGPREVKAELTDLFRQSDNAADFQRRMEEKGYILARGDRRDLVVFDREGGVHSLARRIEGETVKTMRDYMAGIDLASLPSAAEVQGQMTDRHAVEPAPAPVAELEKAVVAEGTGIADAPVKIEVEAGAAPVAEKSAAPEVAPVSAASNADPEMDAMGDRIMLGGIDAASAIMENAVMSVLEVLMPSAPPTAEELAARVVARQEKAVRQAVWEMNEQAYKAWVAQREAELRSENEARGIMAAQSEEQRRLERERREKDRGWERE